MMFQTPPTPPCLLRLLINHLGRSNCKSGVPQGWKLGMSDWGSQGGIGTGATARASRNVGPHGWAPLPRENGEALPQVCWSTKNSWDHSPSVGQKYRSVEDTQQWCLTGQHGNHELCGDVYGGKIWLDGAPLLETWKTCSSLLTFSQRKPGGLWEVRDSEHNFSSTQALITFCSEPAPPPKGLWVIKDFQTALLYFPWYTALLNITLES